MTLVLTPLRDIPLIHPGDDLVQVITNGLTDTSIWLNDNDIIVLAQKIISKAEGRLVDLNQVIPSKQAKKIALEADKDARFVELILRESRKILRVRPGLIIAEHKNGFICANAGIDHSNVQGEPGCDGEWVLLLPGDPDSSADRIRRGLEEKTGKSIGVMIIDSHGRAWRLGIVGVTIGLSGVPGIVDMRGEPDLFGRNLRVTTIGAADELAAGASLIMGQAAEMTPIVHVRGFPYQLTESHLSDIIRPEDKDFFR